MKKLFQITATDQRGLDQAVLCMRIGTKHVSTAVVDRRSKVIYNLCYYAGSRIDVQQLETIFNDHPELRRPYDAVHVGYDYIDSAILPASENEKIDAGSLFQPDEPPVFLRDELHHHQLINSYWVPASIHDWISSQFSQAKFLHQHSIHHHLAAREPKGDLFIDFRNDDFLLIVSRNGEPLLSQVYEYSTPGDVLYYLLRACEQFAFSQQEAVVLVSGLVDRQSGLFHALYQYFIHISFRLPDWDLPAGQHPPHFFTSLNDLALCAS